MTRKSQNWDPVFRPGRTRTGFTLIELLVVIAIISILAGILYPVFAHAREKARQTRCVSSVKQIGNAFQIYAQDYDETFPPLYIDVRNGDIPHSTLVDRPEWKGFSWTERIYPYVKNEELFKCPSDKAGAERAPLNAKFLNSYAYNPLFGTAPDPNSNTRLTLGGLTAAQLNYASETAMLWDTPVNPSEGTAALNMNNLSHPVLDRTRAIYYLYMADRNKKAITVEPGMFTVAVEAPYSWMKPRHAETSTVLFADGHVKSVKDPVAGTRSDAETLEKLNRFFDPRYSSK